MSNNYRDSDVIYTTQRKLIINNQKFSQQVVTFEDTPLFFPTGLEKIFLVIYFVTLPYLAGMALIFFDTSNSDLNLFSSFDATSSFMFKWLIGYEFLAVLTLLWILKNAIVFTIEASSDTETTKKFRRP